MCGYCIEHGYFECLANGNTEAEGYEFTQVISNQEKSTELNYSGLSSAISSSKQHVSLPNKGVKQAKNQVRGNRVQIDMNPHLSETSKKRLTDASIQILTNYYQWWLLGIGKQQSDGLQRLNETGILDPIMDTPTEEWQRFNKVFPTVYSSLNHLLKEDPDNPIIEQIAFTNAEGCPDFEALDLWLQRKAFIHYLQQQGTVKTLNNIVKKGNRIELLWYATMKLNLSGEDVELIIKVLTDNPMLYGSSSACSSYYIEKIETYLDQ